MIVDLFTRTIYQYNLWFVDDVDDRVWFDLRMINA